MGADVEAEPGAGRIDPSEALTVAEAARRAGVPVAEIRRAMDQGRLLFETGRRRGKEMRLVRGIDLALLYPALRGEGTTGPEGALQAELAPHPGTGAEAAPEPAARSGEASRDASREASRDASREASRDASREASGEASGDPVPRPSERGPVAGDSASHALEVRLAAMQASNAALANQVLDLRDIREDLRGQCGDLRVRLTTLEKERQATTAGLLMAQRRLLELEAGPPVPSPLWLRTAVWGTALISVFVLWMWRDAVRAGSGLEEHVQRLSSDVTTGDAALADALSEAAEARRAFAQQLERIEERSRAQLGSLEARLSAERDRADQAGTLLATELEQAEARWNELRDSLRAAREESRRLSLEGEAALAEALAAVAAERASSRSERERAEEARAQHERELLEERRAAREHVQELARELEALRATTTRLLDEGPAASATADVSPASVASGAAPPEVPTADGGVRRKGFAARALDGFRAWIRASNPPR